MKQGQLCSRCANDPNAYVTGVAYEIVPPDQCPRCRTRWIIRLAAVTWLMMVIGAAITVVWVIDLSMGLADVVGVPRVKCVSAWVILLVLFVWYISSSAGKYWAKKAGLLDDDGTFKIPEE